MLHLQLPNIKYGLLRLLKSKLPGKECNNHMQRSGSVYEFVLLKKKNYSETCIHFQWDISTLLNFTFWSPIREITFMNRSILEIWEFYNSRGNFLIKCHTISNIKGFKQRFAGHFIIKNKSQWRKAASKK